MSIFRFPGDPQGTDQAAKPVCFRIEQNQLKTIRRSTREGERNGGAGRDRTDDLMLAKQLLSQLSYSPKLEGGNRLSTVRKIDRGANGGPGTTRTSDLTLIRGAL